MSLILSERRWRSGVKSETSCTSSRKEMMAMRSCGPAVLRKASAALRMKSILSSTLPDTSRRRMRLKGALVGCTSRTGRSIPSSTTEKSFAVSPEMARPLRSVTRACTRASVGPALVLTSKGFARAESEGEAECCGRVSAYSPTSRGATLRMGSISPAAAELQGFYLRQLDLAEDARAAERPAEAVVERVERNVCADGAGVGLDRGVRDVAEDVHGPGLGLARDARARRHAHHEVNALALDLRGADVYLPAVGGANPRVLALDFDDDAARARRDAHVALGDREAGG